MKKKLDNEHQNLIEMKNNERFYKIEKKLETLVNIDEFKNEVNSKVSNQKFEELIDNI